MFNYGNYIDPRTHIYYQGGGYITDLHGQQIPIGARLDDFTSAGVYTGPITDLPEFDPTTYTALVDQPARVYRKPERTPSGKSDRKAAVENAKTVLNKNNINYSKMSDIDIINKASETVTKDRIADKPVSTFAGPLALGHYPGTQITQTTQTTDTDVPIEDKIVDDLLPSTDTRYIAGYVPGQIPNTVTRPETGIPFANYVAQPPIYRTDTPEDTVYRTPADTIIAEPQISNNRIFDPSKLTPDAIANIAGIEHPIVVEKEEGTFIRDADTGEEHSLKRLYRNLGEEYFTGSNNLLSQLAPTAFRPLGTLEETPNYKGISKAIHEIRREVKKAHLTGTGATSLGLNLVAAESVVGVGGLVKQLGVKNIPKIIKHLKKGKEDLSRVLDKTIDIDDIVSADLGEGSNYIKRVAKTGKKGVDDAKKRIDKTIKELQDKWDDFTSEITGGKGKKPTWDDVFDDDIREYGGKIYR